MNNYMIIDGKKYAATHKKWVPVTKRPLTVRKTLLGATDAAYGSGSMQEYTAILQVPTVPMSDDWGSIATLRVTAAKKGSISLTDHDGIIHSAHLMGNFAEESLGSMWDSKDNYFRVPVRMVV